MSMKKNRPSTTNKPVAKTEPRPGTIVAEHYEGMIPHPRLMRDWDDLVPGSAKQIFDRFEKQSDNRISSEQRVIKAHNFKLYAGPILAFIISMTAIVGGVLMVLIAKEPVAGGLISFSGLGTVTAPFLISEYKKRNSKD